MVLELTETQLQFFLKDRRFKSATIELLRKHYVEGLSLEEIANNSLTTSQRVAIYRSFQRFEGAIKEKLISSGLRVATVFVRSDNLDRVFDLDELEL